MIYWLKTGKAIEEITTIRDIDLPLDSDSVDISGNDHVITPTGVTYSDAAVFNGSANIVTDYQPDSAYDFEFSDWIYIDSTLTWNTAGTSILIGGLMTSGYKGLAVVMSQTSNRIFAYLRQSSPSVSVITAYYTITRDTWYNVRVKYDASDLRIYFYVDNNLIGSATGAFTSSGLFAPFKLGMGNPMSGSGVNPLIGMMKKFRSYNRHLSTTESVADAAGLEISPYLYDVDSDCFPIDTTAIQINLDNPQRKYNVKKIIGNGASISGGDYYGDRKITFSRIFKKDGVSTSGALTVARNNFINKYITLSDDLYLIRDYNAALQFIQVFPMMGGEKYKNLLISEDFDITLYCALPFFTDAEETITDSFSKTSRYFDYDLTVVGLPVPMIFEGTFSSNDSNLVLGVFENFGVSITYNFLANDVVKFDSGAMRLWVNDVERFNATIVGTPFVLLSGDTTLRIECIADMTGCTVTYTGRYI
jgi:hypothetical protein